MCISNSIAWFAIGFFCAHDGADMTFNTSVTKSADILVTVISPKSAKAGEPLVAEMTIENQGKEPIVLTETGLPVLAAKLVNKRTRAEVAPTPFGKFHFGQRYRDGSMDHVRIEPGMKKNYAIEFHKYYEPPSGEYAWTAELKFSPEAMPEVRWIKLKDVEFEIIGP